MGKPNKALLIGIGIIVVAVIGIFALAFGSSKSDAEPTGGVTASAAIEIPLSEITSIAKFFEYESGGTTIRFFAVRASDGSIKTGFDACDVCYGSHKGYRQEGDFMVCNNCGNKYPIAGLGSENKNPGGCWPGFLPSSISGDNIVIQNSDLDANKWRFA